ncbi:hypothetical protein [Halobacteriovorax sp. RZ-2]|uniref:hypothetical protein n=1 Tax=unclassified Halobacteriovorax TaxID=2639665 RepID=UPI003720C4E0
MTLLLFCFLIVDDESLSRIQQTAVIALALLSLTTMLGTAFHIFLYGKKEIYIEVDDLRITFFNGLFFKKHTFLLEELESFFIKSIYGNKALVFQTIHNRKYDFPFAHIDSYDEKKLLELLSKYKKL